MPTTHYVPTILYQATHTNVPITHFYHLIQMPGETPQASMCLYGFGLALLQPFPAASYRVVDKTTQVEHDPGHSAVVVEI